ncbi:hypothetical protein Gpo141_00006842 [Globisporangium polare]
MAMSWIAHPILVEDYVETSKQITKALKCVAFTNMQVGDMMMRKHERLEKRIFSISEEIELLQADVAENVLNQRERRQQLTDIEEDVERAEVLGNALMVEELLVELTVLQDEGKREEALLRSIKKALRSRRRVQKQFIAEKKDVEDEMRTFNRKQNLIQSLLTTFAKDSVNAGPDSQSSSASQSDCGSDLDADSLLSMGVDDTTKSESPSFLRPSALKKNPLVMTRPRRWSADESYSMTPPPKPRTRARRSLSVTFSPDRPRSLGSVEEESDEEIAYREQPEAGDQTTADQVFKSANVDANATTSGRLLLEEIHDEQDNFYSHYSSESSDHDDTESGSEVEDEDDVHQVEKEVVEISAPAGKKGLVETPASNEEEPVTKTTMTLVARGEERPSTARGIAEIRSTEHYYNSSSSTAITTTSCDQVEVTLVRKSEAMVIEELHTV